MAVHSFDTGDGQTRIDFFQIERLVKVGATLQMALIQGWRVGHGAFGVLKPLGVPVKAYDGRVRRRVVDAYGQFGALS